MAVAVQYQVNFISFQYWYDPLPHTDQLRFCITVMRTFCIWWMMKVNYRPRLAVGSKILL